jgi:replication-associated recombination protein RarA
MPDALPSLIFWGPPGVGKTTIARLLAAETDLHFVQISAIFTGVPDLRKVFEAARHRHANGQGTLLFVDEIHRFNKAQQDGFLPHMEDGTILLVGRDDREPVLRAERRPPVPGAGAGAGTALGRGALALAGTRGNRARPRRCR